MQTVRQIQVCLIELYHKQIQISTTKRSYTERGSEPTAASGGRTEASEWQRSRDWQCPTAHRAVGFCYSSTFPGICKKADTRMGICFLVRRKGLETLRIRSVKPSRAALIRAASHFSSPFLCICKKPDTHSGIWFLVQRS